MNPETISPKRPVGLMILFVLLGIIVVFFAINNYIYNAKQVDTAADYKDAEYVIDGKRVKLKDGLAETEAAPGSASKIITRYFGNEVKHDLNDDGREDVVFLLTQEMGGSGTFFYVVAALNTEEGYVGSQAILLGDRIAPQTTELSRNHNHKNVIVVNYADRATGEPMTTQPSIGKSIWLKLDAQAMQFGEVVQDFPGEADVSRMKLDMKTWVWISALYNDGKKVEPKKQGKFTVTFSIDGKVSGTTDCNSFGGSYTVTENRISFGDMFSTKMYCESSQEGDFMNLLRDATSFHFTSRGELILDLKFDSGSVTFR